MTWRCRIAARGALLRAASSGFRWTRCAGEASRDLVVASSRVAASLSVWKTRRVERASRDLVVEPRGGEHRRSVDASRGRSFARPCCGEPRDEELRAAFFNRFRADRPGKAVIYLDETGRGVPLLGVADAPAAYPPLSLFFSSFSFLPLFFFFFFFLIFYLVGEAIYTPPPPHSSLAAPLPLLKVKILSLE